MPLGDFPFKGGVKSSALLLWAFSTSPLSGERKTPEREKSRQRKRTIHFAGFRAVLNE